MHANNIPVYGWILVAVLLISQASWIFLDASKRGENKWLWGLYGLTNVPSSLIVYLLVTRIFLSGKICTSCKKKYRVSYRYCPHCGKEAEIK
jgi:hypothetical protein